MKLLYVLDNVNQLEKGSFLKIIDNAANNIKDQISEVEDIIETADGGIKKLENENVVKLFHFTRDSLKNRIKEKLCFNNFQLDILIDILSRDGNSIMSRSWFENLYKAEINKLTDKLNNFKKNVEAGGDIEPLRLRDYRTYLACVKTAFTNDELNNRENIITHDEQSILNTLSCELELSSEEIRLIKYSIIEMVKLETDTILKALKDLGVAFYSQKKLTIYIPDEIVCMLREINGLELPCKYVRRILSALSNTEVNRISKAHSIPHKLNREDKEKEILAQGISLHQMLLKDAVGNQASKSDQKDFLSKIIDTLELNLDRLGTTADERLSKIISYFKNLELDNSLKISKDSYSQLLKDLNKHIDGFKSIVQNNFELEQDNILNSELMIDYNIMPLDILYLLTKEQLQMFIQERGAIKSRGKLRINILNAYKDMANLYKEHYSLIGARDLNGLKENGIEIKESDLGNKYEQLTKEFFSELGFNVDEDLRTKINSSRNKVDILINLENQEVIIVECKSKKDRDFNNYASVSRQIQAYEQHCENKGLSVKASILISNGFTEEFIVSCDEDPYMNITLISSDHLMRLRTVFKDSKMKQIHPKFFNGGEIDISRLEKVLQR